jgi:hypothetical protein
MYLKHQVVTGPKVVGCLTSQSTYSSRIQSELGTPLSELINFLLLR